MRLAPLGGLCLSGVLVACAASAATGDSGPESNRREEVYASELEARDRIFGRGQVWHDSAITPDSADRSELALATGVVETESPVVLHWTGGTDGRLIGAYRVASEVGKYLPFDFLVALDSQLAVKEVVVLTYRESRGGQVQRARFMNQFRGKTASSALSLNRDVIGISGATLSAQAVARGVKKTLWWARRMFGSDRGAP